MGKSEAFDRKSAIGASEAVAVLSPADSPWLTPYQLQQRKLGREQEKPTNTAMKLGNALEPVIGSLLQEERGWSLVHMNETARHIKAPNVAASPDFLSSDKTFGVETKAIFRTAHEWGDEGSLDVPVRYLTQVHLNMAVWDMPVWYLAALIGPDLKVYRVERDEALEAFMVERLQEWYEKHVVAGDHRGDDLLLMCPKLPVPEDVGEHPARVLDGSRRIRDFARRATRHHPQPLCCQSLNSVARFDRRAPN